MAFRDRIKELRRVKAGELLANPKNWREHPEGQASALSGMLAEVGFVGALIARETPAGLELLDGHLRADLAEDAEVPVLVVDVNEQEANKVLATFDPLSALAIANEQALADLLGEVELDHHAELRKVLEDLSKRLAEEEQAEAEERPEVPGMALQPHEHYDYLVVLAATTHEWNSLCDLLQLESTKRRKRMGVCRAVRADRLIELLRGDTPPAAIARQEGPRNKRGRAGLPAQQKDADPSPATRGKPIAPAA
jgi:hypothetical protein